MEVDVVWGTQPEAMVARAERYKRQLLLAIFSLAQEWAVRLADEMRLTASWTDRTGLARRTLFGRAFRIAVGAVLVLGGRAPYQVFLERRWSGRYAVILPTLQRAYAAIMRSLQALIG